MKATSSQGLTFAFSDRGAVRSIEVDPIRISLTVPAPSSPSGTNLYLRVRGGAYTPLLGSAAPGSFRVTERGFEARGAWGGLAYQCLLRLSSSDLSWQWSVQVRSAQGEPVALEVLYVQDVGLKTAGTGPVNEAYVSQYLERKVLEDARLGSVVCCRQNMEESGGHPWLMLACADGAVAASTDGAQLYGSSYRATGEPEALRRETLGGELAGESSIVALQSRPFVLEPGETHTTAFVATYLRDHPEASGAQDLKRLPELVRAFAAAAPVSEGALTAPRKGRFDDVPILPVDDLTQAQVTELFGSARRHLEQEGGELRSFFADGPTHVTLRAKEVRVDRPHGHILQAQTGLVPDERIMSTTAFACGVFHSHVTQGNTNFTTLLAVCSNPAMPSLESGQRILVQQGDEEFLLGVPSAFEMGLSHCRWIYASARLLLEVWTWTSQDAPRVNLHVNVLRGGPVQLTVVHAFDALNGWTITPAGAHTFLATPRAGSMITGPFPEARYRMVVNSPDAGYRVGEDEAATLSGGDPERSFFVLEVARTSVFGMSLIGEVTGASDAKRIDDAPAQGRADVARAVSAWRDLSRDLTLRGPAAIAPIQEILPWYAQNALVHYLTPYGLEQFSGAAWGTRDVSQGPIDLLLCQEKYGEAKQVLRAIFSHQNADGGWPQWWMFDSFRAVRADSAHGDVIYWTILALCSYLKASGDFAFLGERLPYFQPDAPADTLSEHVDRILKLVVDSFVPGTALVQFGGGDWNDSLQPVSKDLARRLISSWTVQMCYQALRAYREVCKRAGNPLRAGELDQLAERVLADFHRHLVKDGMVAGYGLVGADQSIEVLLHPTDQTTGVHYSLLPMNRGVISGVFSREQAERHAEVIEQHLKGPDGARLMDRPLRYRGGPQTIFQRAESSTYFGREIGLMYVHEHLRYAEAQARLGKAEALLLALRQAIPVDYAEVVPPGAPRQANCYYSSSDVVFRSRYEADERYGDVLAGKLPLVGGWRVYSSGPGIYVALVVTRLLGLRIEYGQLVIDPVLAPSLDGLEASLLLRGRRVTFAYRVCADGFGPRAISVNGAPLSFSEESNRYRRGGAVVPLDSFVALLGEAENRVDLQV